MTSTTSRPDTPSCGSSSDCGRDALGTTLGVVRELSAWARDAGSQPSLLTSWPAPPQGVSLVAGSGNPTRRAGPVHVPNAHSPLSLALGKNSVSALAAFTKYHRQGGFNNRHVFLTVLGTRSRRSRCQQTRLLVRTLFLAGRWQLPSCLVAPLLLIRAPISS